MLRAILVTTLLIAANGAIYASPDCNKCCGLLDPGTDGHRDCDEINSTCHVVRCAVPAGQSSCCWSSSDRYNDKCADNEAEEGPELHECL
jgi:hypothetical protein